MALYLGNKQQKLTFGNQRKMINFYSTLEFQRDKLLSSDNYILKDSMNLFLLPKEDE